MRIQSEMPYLSSRHAWQRPPEQPELHPGEVHLWCVHLDALAGDHEATLSVEECMRATRFHFPRDRERFAKGRGILRTVLSRYTRIPAGTLRFRYGPNGKPVLDYPNTTLRFNISHSDGLLLIAVGDGREIGVDVEAIRRDVPFEDLAQSYFAPEDAWEVRILPSPEKALKFYDIWTGIEAQLKAAGTGLSGGTGVPDPGRWSLRKITPAEGFAACLAVEGEAFQLECWSWPN